MTFLQMLALVIVMVNAIAIIYLIRRLHYRYYLRPKKPKSGHFWIPVMYPEEGEDAAFCDLCHGRLGAERIAACACGKRFHTECALRHDCPNCGNDIDHMFHPKPLVMLCPICLRRSPGGYCTHCRVTYPHREGTFRCVGCGAKVLTSNPQCRRCGKKYHPKITKGYMNKVRSRR